MTAPSNPNAVLWSTAQMLMGIGDRPEQTELFLRALGRDDGIVAMQGPTGSGKSMYAVPTLMRAGRNERIIYACATKSQQRQVHEAIGGGLTEVGLGPSALLFGRNEYYCWRRAMENRVLVAKKLTELGQLTWDWEPPGIREDGLRIDYPELPDEVWRLVNSNADDGCDPDVCGGDDAHAYAKSRAREARLLIVNHHLLTIGQGRGVPRYRRRLDRPSDQEIVIVDEAHELPDILASVHGAEISPYRLTRAAGQMDRLYGQVPPTWEGLVRQWETATRPGSKFDEEPFNGYAVAESLADDADLMVTRLVDAAEAIIVIAGDMSPANKAARKRRGKLRACAGMMERLHEDLRRMEPTQGYARWIDKMHPDARTGRAHAVPLDVRPYAKALFDRHRSVTVMSATLAGHPADRLGVDPVLVGRSPFDLAANRLSYVTGRSLDKDQWKVVQPVWPDAAACDELAELVRIAGGRTLVLATSHRSKDRALQGLLDRGINAVAQGRSTSTVPALIERLRQEEVDALVGVDSLATGIDISGPALSQVVWLAWPNPETRTHLGMAITGRYATNHEAWDKYWSPAAKLKTEQGIGRLIRTDTDRGVVALLDPRFRFKRTWGGLVAPSKTIPTFGAVRHHFAQAPVSV